MLRTPPTLQCRCVLLTLIMMMGTVSHCSTVPYSDGVSVMNDEFARWLVKLVARGRVIQVLLQQLRFECRHHHHHHHHHHPVHLYCTYYVLNIGAFQKSHISDSGFGCYIVSQFFGCIMYADDLIMLSPSLKGLQSMFNLRDAYAKTHFLIFNAKKRSLCQ